MRSDPRPRPPRDSRSGPGTPPSELPDFGVELRFVAGRAVVGLRGELDLASAPTLSELLARLTAGNVDIEVDVRHLTFIDCSGVDPLVRAARAVRDPGRVVVSGPTPPVARVLDLLAVGDHVRIER